MKRDVVRDLARKRLSPTAVGERLAHGRQGAPQPFDSVESSQIFLSGRPVGMAISLGDRLQFFTDLEEFHDLDGARFADRAALLGQLRRAQRGRQPVGTTGPAAA
jgi:hypothetical protein